MADLQSAADTAGPRRKSWHGQDVTATPAAATGPLSPPLAPHAEADPDLARVVAVWDSLPQHIRQSILALVNATARPVE
jgi:hypothetical protein